MDTGRTLRRPIVALAAAVVLLTVGTVLLVAPAPQGSVPAASGQTHAVSLDPAVAGTAGRDDLDAALRTMTVDDRGVARGPMRWETDTVGVHVAGHTGPDAIAGIDEVLSWLTGTTGVHFHRTADADTAGIHVQLEIGVAPHAILHPDGSRLRRVDATWDPTHRWAARWQWEELLHAAGPYGDWGPDGAIISKDQTAVAPSDFDSWILKALYQADPLDTSTITGTLRRLQ